jgi:hypothetical protein
MMMKKTIPIICCIVSAILVIAFIIKNVTDYSHYSPTFNSAPFSAWVLANALYFILPAILVLVAGIIVKKKL